jgi:diguanylate cyclase (GGDEF)-like protein
MQRQSLARTRTLPSLPVHAWLNQLGFPRSYTGKFYLIAFLANALPLAAITLYVVLAPEWLSSRTTFFLVLATTVLGGLLASMALAGLLHPIYQAHQALKAYLDGGEVPPLSFSIPNGEDEGSALVRNLNYAVAMFEAHQNISRRESPRDFLTGLLNRSAAEERLSHLTRSIQLKPFDMSVALLKLTNLKEINEQYGYPVGDQVLRRVARTITHQLRGTDWVARWSGQELVVAVQANDEGAAHAMRRIQQDVETSILEVGEHIIPVTVKLRHTPIRAGEPLAQLVERLDMGEIRTLSD